MARKKRTKKEEMMDAINDMEDMKTSRRNELLDFNFPIRIKFKNKKQKELSDMIKNNRITFIKGAAGTGKTIITLKTALEMLKDSKSKIGDIMLSTMIVEVGGDSIGYLPGDIGMKTEPYFEHFYDNLIKIVGKEVTTFLRQTKLVDEKILNFVRGTTFGKYDDNGEPIGTVCILDESQSSSVHQLRTFISRLGENSKLVILGDPDQSDIKFKNGEMSGLEDAIERFKDMKNVGVFEFSEDDIVRDPFLIEIMKRYKD